jgi:hypothetical protein
MHLQHVRQQYPKDGFLTGCHRVVQIAGEIIQVALDTAKWTKVMDGQWEIQPAQPMVCASETLISKTIQFVFYR